MKSLGRLLILSMLLCPNFYWSQKPVERVALKPAHQVIDTLDYLYYSVGENFEIRINKEEYLFHQESSLMFDRDCSHDHQYWQMIKNPSERDLRKIIPASQVYSLENYIYYELLEKHAVIWDNISKAYQPYFLLRDYEDIGTGGKEVTLIRSGKSDDPLSEGYGKQVVILRKILRVY